MLLHPGGTSALTLRRPPLDPLADLGDWQVLDDGRPVGRIYEESLRLGMARGFLTFGDIEGKLDVLRVECTRCDRRGSISSVS